MATRRLQISVRTLFAVTAIVAIMCLVWRSFVQPFHDDKRAAALATELGGRVGFETCAPKWIRSLRGDANCQRVVALDFNYGPLTGNRPVSTAITDEQLKEFADLTELKELLLYGSLITDDGMRHLSRLTKLEVLWLDRTKITDDGLVHLKRLVNLRCLGLYDCEIGDEGMAHISGLTNLERLELQGTNVGDAGIVHLYNMRNLRSSLMHQSFVTQSGLDRLSRQLPNFRTYRIATRSTLTDRDAG